MDPDWFAIQMVVTLGSLSGSGIGLIIGFALGKQKSRWSAMTRHEKLINIACVTLCSVICSAMLGYYAFAGLQN
jgi:membrane protein YqaA with SNARE-associated domain